jgi:hypothetical protein
MRIDHEAISSRSVLAAAEFQRKVFSLLQRLRDRLDGSLDEVLAQAVLQRHAPANRRRRLARAGGRS